MSQAKIIKHMIITVLIVILSAFLWQSIPNDNGANIAKLFDNRDILVTFDGFTQLPNIADQYYKKIDTVNLNLRNIDKENKEYKLYFVYSKQSTVDANTLKMELDNKVYDLSKIEVFEDGDYFYYFLYEDTLDAYSSKDISVRIWTSSEDGTLKSSFAVK